MQVIANGNMTGDGVRTYSYDGENRLIKVTQGSSTWHYVYDYLGRRIEKRGTGITKTRFLYDGWNVIAELDGSNTIVRRFAWGLDVSGSLQGAGGIGGLLVIDAGTQYHPLYDASHNVIGLYNSSGSLQAAYAYDAFGNLQTSAGTYAASNPFRSATKYTDSETGFVYYGMRYFSPTLGRFINRDPIEEGGGLNLYLFCMNDGVNRYDYLGMNAFTDWAVAILNSISSFLGNMSGDVLVLDRMIVTPGENDSNVSKPSDDSPGYLSMVASNRAVTDYQNENTMDESAPNSGVSNYGGQANGVKFAPDAEKGPIIQTVAYLSQSKTFREAWKRVVDSSTPVRVGTLRFDPKSSAAYGQSYPQGSRIVMWFDPGRAAVTADGRTLYPAQVFAHEVYHVLSLMNPSQREIDATTYSSLYRAGSVEEANAVTFANQIARELGLAETRIYGEGTATPVTSPLPPIP